VDCVLELCVVRRVVHRGSHPPRGCRFKLGPCDVSTIIGCLVEAHKLLRDRSSIIYVEGSRELPSLDAETLSAHLVLHRAPIGLDLANLQIDGVKLHISFRFEPDLHLTVKTELREVNVEEDIVRFYFQSALTFWHPCKRVTSYRHCQPIAGG